MNKKLIALAVAGACVAPAAMAQTANPVTLYGLAYITLESVEAKGGTTSVPRRNRVTDQSSRIGIRGTEDLGGGLKAFFQLETGFNTESVQSTYATRNSGIGLQGNWGSILAGRWDTPMKVTMGALDPFADNQLGDISAAALKTTSWDLRPDNVIQYWSPTMGGFALRAMYVANEGKSTTVNPYMYGGSLSYTGGPFYVAYAYEKHKAILGPGATAPVTATAGIDDEGQTLGAAFTIGTLKLSGMYGEFKRSTSTAALALTKQKTYFAAAEWKLGPHSLLASYQNSKDGGLPGAAQPKCDVFAPGYKYNFSARSFFIASYAKVNNKTGNLCNFGQATLTIAADQDPQGFSIGMRTAF